MENNDMAGAKKKSNAGKKKPKATCQVTGKTQAGKTKRVCHGTNGKIISFEKAKQVGYTTKRRKAS
ncbi:MAG: hypothetical protein ACYS7M_16125 [Planctomycetota bacterium]|jgi:hypothetical protein